MKITIPYVTKGSDFPNPNEAIDDGLLAFGDILSADLVLDAYTKGIFPWYGTQDPVLWWSPNPRLILYPNDLKISKSLQKSINKDIFNVKFDTNFKEVIKKCASVYRKNQNGTWIVTEIKKVYTQLHKLGYAHSVEAYLGDELVGGLYGISIGKAFFGESMFATHTDASKVAFYHLIQKLKTWNFDFIDCQVPTNHLKSLGAIEVDREYFLNILEKSLQKQSHIHKWE